MAKRTDSNQREIVDALRKCGASVFILSNVGKGCPDLLIGMNGKNFLAEIKDGSKPPSGQKLTEREQVFFNSWKGQVCLLRSIDEVLQLIDLIKNN
jgi:hypothetical protein